MTPKLVNLHIFGRNQVLSLGIENQKIWDGLLCSTQLESHSRENGNWALNYPLCNCKWLFFNSLHSFCGFQVPTLRKAGSSSEINGLFPGEQVGLRKGSSAIFLKFFVMPLGQKIDPLNKFTNRLDLIIIATTYMSVCGVICLFCLL